VSLFNAPGESRECVEVARRLLGFARAGIAFDRMAILVRSPEEYRPHLVEALARARIPAHFARGAVQPDPTGRAFLALLACAGEGLSARRFAEYLSLGQVPDATPAGAPPAAANPGERWVAPDEELVSDAIARTLGVASPDSVSPGTDRGHERPAVLPGDAPVQAGTLRAPRRWEQLLVDAAVIGGRDRWVRRLGGLAAQLDASMAEIEDPEDPAHERLARRKVELANLRSYGLPLLDALVALPESAAWAAWLDALSALATRALRSPARVLSVLAELAPMAEVGPVSLGEVQWVLARRLLEVALPPARSRYGSVYVAPVEAARGLSFDVVCVPGLAERLFPRKISEEPILLDPLREELGAGLETNSSRVERERLALRLAAGAARKHLVLSYPRIDLDQSRPRVPSFYALEALRAAEGRLPGFEELKARAETAVDARVGWPAPRDSSDAIDEAEHDLALLDTLLTQDESESVGTARFLLDANPYLGRSLRFRARRWLRSWTQADGLVAPPRGELAAGAREALAGQGLAQRSFSPTALEKYASCPYRFFLHTVLRLSPREEPEAIDEMNPLQRGSLVHDVQFELFGRLSAAGQLPLEPAKFGEAREQLDSTLDEVAAHHREELAPAIDRVWDDGVASLRADLREWLRRCGEDGSGFVPWRFELAFGLPGRAGRDPNSVKDPVLLDSGIQLRGSIDLVERSSDGRVRVTDHKTGRQRFEEGEVVAGGSALQPVLYALAAEKLFPDDAVESGRLYYCTSAGGFEERVVPLDERARQSAVAVAQTVVGGLAEPFLPAAPAEGACRWCDYAEVCGPYEELRASRKPAGHPGLEALRALRGLR
jgi:RecB family exonuclease